MLSSDRIANLARSSADGVMRKQIKELQLKLAALESDLNYLSTAVGTGFVPSEGDFHDTVIAQRAIRAANAHKAVSQRDVAWEELREIREAINANPEESTADEVRRLRKQYGDMLTTLQAIARGEYCEGEEVSMTMAAIPKVMP